MSNIKTFKKDVTLILTIFERKKYTLRWLNYANQINIPLNIFIADGSKKKQLSILELKRYRNLKIQYKKFRYYKNFKKLCEKFFMSTKLIKTKYVYLCEDDDFLILRNIYKSYLFMENNNNYIASGGANIYCDMQVKKRSIINYLHFFKSETQLLPDNKLQKSTDCAERIVMTVANPYAAWNIMFRREVLEKVFYHLNNLNIKSIYNIELAHNFLTSLYGQINRFKHLEYIKTTDTEYSSSRLFVESKLFKNYILNGKKEAKKILLYFYSKFQNKIGIKNFQRIEDVFLKKVTYDYDKRLNETKKRVFIIEFFKSKFYFLKKIKYFRLFFKKNYKKKFFFASDQEEKILMNCLRDIIILMNFLKKNNTFLSKF